MLISVEKNGCHCFHSQFFGLLSDVFILYPFMASFYVKAFKFLCPILAFYFNDEFPDEFEQLGIFKAMRQNEPVRLGDLFCPFNSCSQALSFMVAMNTKFPSFPSVFQATFLQ